MGQELSMNELEQRIEFDLLRNAVDSIDRAIELMAWEDALENAKRLKQAVLAISHGVELLLKERLRRVHPVLIWENVDKFPSLSARTVTVDSALSRLKKIGGLSFSQTDSDLIESLRNTRNAIEHYAWSTTKREADLIVGRALGFAVHFAKAELGYEFFGYSTRKDDTVMQLLERHPEISKAFSSRYEQHATGDDSPSIVCDFCRGLTVKTSTGACQLCGHWNRIYDDGDDPIPF
jgi:hypothetical protein